MKHLLAAIPLLLSTMAIGPCAPVPIGNLDGGPGGSRSDTGVDGVRTGGAGVGGAMGVPMGGRPAGSGGTSGLAGVGGGPSLPDAGAGGGGAGGVSSVDCPAGAWEADAVPSIASTFGTPLGSTMDNTGHVYEVRWLEADWPRSLGPRHHFVHVRPPKGPWSSFELAQEGSLQTYWRGINPMAVFGASIVLLYSGGAGLETMARPASFAVNSAGDKTLHRPPMNWPAEPFFPGGSLPDAMDERGAVSFIHGQFTNGKGSLWITDLPPGIGYVSGGSGFPPSGRNPQLDTDAARGLYVLYQDDDTQTIRLGTKATTDVGWSFGDAPAGSLLVTPGGVPTVLGPAAGGAGLVLYQRRSVGWEQTTIDPTGGAAVDGADSKGTIHIAYTTGSELRYGRLSAMGVLGTETVARSTVAPNAVRIDALGVVRIFDGNTVYRRCTRDPGFAVPPLAGTWKAGPPSPALHQDYKPTAIGQYVSRAAYDPGRDRVVVAVNPFGVTPDPTRTWEWDGVTATWSRRSDTAPTKFVDPRFEMAYDEGSSRIIAIGYEGTFAYDATAGTWTTLSTAFWAVPVPLFYDATAGLLAIGSDKTSRWDSATATWVAAPNVAAGQPAGTKLVADLGRRRILAHKTSDTATGWDWTTIWEWSSSGGWAARVTPSTMVPSGPGQMVYAGAGEMALVSADGEAWSWSTSTAAWTRTGAGPIYRLPQSLAYAGGRRVVAFGYSGGGEALSRDPLPDWNYIASVTWQLTVDQ